MRFVVGKMLMAVSVAITVSVIGFLLLRLSGDLASILAGQDATDAQVAEVARRYGLDRPLPIQYFSWLGGVLQGDFGRSLFTQEAVTRLVGDRIGVTLTLAASGLAVALLFAVPFGIAAAVWANSWLDRAVIVVTVFCQAIPNFWLALILIYVFGVKLRLLPIVGSDTPAHFILPTAVLATMVMPALMRLTRAGMVDVLSADYVRTAWAKGLSPLSVVVKHALRNAVLPVISLASVSFGFLLGGSVIVESVFGLNGIGLLAFDSIMRGDFPVVQTVLIIVSFAYIVLNLLSDLVNAWLDPRLREQ